MKFFRNLTPGEIECRVQKCSAKGVSVLLYKTARTDADILDETVGPERWANDFRTIDGVLYGGIGVDYGKEQNMVWKWDAGSESNMEADKGRASDAFKRAGFKHGIGRELYSAPFIWIPAGKCKSLKQMDGGRYTCYDDFKVAAIQYDDADKITGLAITSAGEIVYMFGDVGESEHMCADCGRPIVDAKRRDGSIWPAADIAAYTLQRYGRKLCTACGKKAEQAWAYAHREDGVDE